MDKLCAILILGLIASQATCMNIRNKRQVDNSPEELEDRYALNRPNNVRPDRFPIQNIFPDQNPFDNNNDFIIIGFPNQGLFPNKRPLPGQGQQQQQTSTTSTTTSGSSVGGVTTISPSVEECMRTCPVTPEFNPVCGSDNQTYSNPGRLTCAQACGVNVSLSRLAPCPPATAATN